MTATQVRLGVGSRGAIAPASEMPSQLQWLYIVGMAVMFFMPGGMLWYAGYNYDGLTGSPVTKIHPGSYLVLAAFALAAFHRGNPVAFVVDAAGRRPASLLLVLVAIIVFLQIVYRKGPGLAGIVDTYMLPPFVFALFVYSGQETKGRLETVVHAAMIANALLGLFEFATHHLYFPYRFDGAVFPEDARSTGLQGHPLGNAIITAIYVLSLLCGGGRLPIVLRSAVVVLEVMALVAFGGRSAIVTTALLGTVVCVFGVCRALASGRVPVLGVAAVILVATAAPIIVAGLWAGGFFDALLIRFVSDGGSANARVEMMSLVARIPLRDLVIGPDIGWVESMRRTSGLEMGIENPVIRMLLYQGGIVTALLVVAVGLFLHEIVRESRRGILMPVLAFLIIANTFESLASKSTLLAKFALMMLVLFRTGPSGAASSRHPVAPIRPVPPTRVRSAPSS